MSEARRANQGLGREARGAQIVLGVAGGIAAYKACELIRRLRADGHGVRVVPTDSALNFVGAATFEALSGQSVATGVFTDVASVAHVRIGQEADLVVIAPATADLLARAATGRADDLLTATLLVTRAPVLMAPAMHTEMWLHPATVANVATLRERGVCVIDPAVGRLTGADSGPGRLPDPEHVAALAELLLDRSDALPQDLRGRRVLVTAGGTREPLDPVRFLGNRSSGKQGHALALVAAARGADVTLISANTALNPPPGVTEIRVGTAVELERAVAEHRDRADAIVMSAAVADFRPVDLRVSKIKKRPGQDPEPLHLTTNPDILRGLTQWRTGSFPLIIGFAAETGDESGSVLEHGRAKLTRKGCDLLVVNPVGGAGFETGFETDVNQATILGRDGSAVPVPLMTKTALAAAIWDAVSERLPSPHYCE